MMFVIPAPLAVTAIVPSPITLASAMAGLPTITVRGFRLALRTSALPGGRTRTPPCHTLAGTEVEAGALGAGGARPSSAQADAARQIPKNAAMRYAMIAPLPHGTIAQVH